MKKENKVVVTSTILTTAVVASFTLSQGPTVLADENYNKVISRENLKEYSINDEKKQNKIEFKEEKNSEKDVNDVEKKNNSYKNTHINNSQIKENLTKDIPTTNLPTIKEEPKQSSDETLTGPPIIEEPPIVETPPIIEQPSIQDPPLEESPEDIPLLPELPSEEIPVQP